MLNVLVIDDEKYVADVIERAMKRFGYGVKAAMGGQEGLHLFEENHFDLVITDIVMPDMTGIAVSRYIRNSKRSKTPIIGISGTPWLLKDDDFDVVLSKPFTMQNLSDAVDRLMCCQLEGDFYCGRTIQ